MRIMNVSIAGLGTLLALSGCGEPERAGLADAVGGPHASGIVEPSFGDLDRNDDGLLTTDETTPVPALRRIFSLADRDQDGMLNISEFSHATIEGTKVSPDAARGPLYLSLDTDRNDRINREEAHAVPQLEENFDRYDSDGSGGIDPREYADALDEGLTPQRQ
jgi:Ca2+-binding EF-hand superfamily protein